jgi:amino acid transporter
MLGALWAYDGWNNIAFMAGEVKRPERNLPLALISSMILVMLLYVFDNISYYHVLTPTQIASVPASSSTAAEVIRRGARFSGSYPMAAAMMTRRLAPSMLDPRDGARALRDGSRSLVL